MAVYGEAAGQGESIIIRLGGAHGARAPRPSGPLALLSLSAVFVPLTPIAASTRNEQDLLSAGTRAGPLLFKRVSVTP